MTETVETSRGCKAVSFAVMPQHDEQLQTVRPQKITSSCLPLSFSQIHLWFLRHQRCDSAVFVQVSRILLVQCWGVDALSARRTKKQNISAAEYRHKNSNSDLDWGAEEVLYLHRPQRGRARGLTRWASGTPPGLGEQELLFFVLGLEFMIKCFHLLIKLRLSFNLLAAGLGD